MTQTTKRWVLASGAVAVVGIVLAAFFVLRGGSDDTAAASGTPALPDGGTVAQQYLTAWTQGRDDGAAALTDDPAAASATLKATRTALAPTAFAATLGQLQNNLATTHVKWTLGGGRVWAYDTQLRLVQQNDAWKVHFTAAAVHPALVAGDRLTVQSGADGPALTDRDGRVLMTWQAGGPKAIDPAFAPLVLPAAGRLIGGLTKKWSVARVDSGNVAHTLYSEGDGPAKTYSISLSSKAQQAAQAAVDAAGAPAMLVAIQPSTGDILAVAQNSRQAPGNPLTGLYAPGSTFKIATATAVLEAGLADANTVLPCPGTVQLGQRTIPNDDQFSLAPLPLHSAFAHSCNTTFAQLASQLPNDALANAATQLGLNADFDIPGLITEAGKVVPSPSAADQVESAIGQGSVQASPFGLALMAATVASGKAVTPQLVRDQSTSVTTNYQPPPAGVLSVLRSMMREVVTGGTATGLAGNGDVRGKTGTAQFGDGSQANGWFAGYRGDVAFSVLLVGANSSKPAVTASAAFLKGL